MYYGREVMGMVTLRRLVSLSAKLLLLLVVLAGFVSSAVFAVITLIPDSSASKESMLGYQSHCSFAPISTIILVVMAAAFGFVFVRKYVKRGCILEKRP